METEYDLFLMQTPSDTSISSFLISLFTILHNLASVYQNVVIFTTFNFLSCSKLDSSRMHKVWWEPECYSLEQLTSSHSWENAFRKCKDGHVERAYVKGSLDFGMALVNFSHGSITRKISPCSSYPDIRKVIQKDFAWDIPRRVNVVLGGGKGGRVREGFK